MVEEVAQNLFRIGVPLPNNPLKELNSYLIRGNDRELLIDTGFRSEVCHQALTAGLEELRSDPSRRDVLITHLHSDHSGMADLFVGPGRQIYMSEVEITYKDLTLNGEYLKTQNERLVSEGFPRELQQHASGSDPGRTMAMPAKKDPFCGLKDGAVIEAGAYRLQMISVPGHTPGNSMFWMERQGIMFSGDHILFDITPNITSWAGVEDSLGHYLDSLKKVRRYPVRQTLPGHRKTGDYHARIDALLRHHDARLSETLKIVTETPGLSAYDIAGRMTWQIRARSWAEFPPVQKLFAVRECLSHLDYLRVRGKIRRAKIDGIDCYEVC